MSFLVHLVFQAADVSHSGGGAAENLSMDKNGPPLRWMSYEAISAGLIMHPFRGTWNLGQVNAVHESLTWVWRPFEYLPIKKLSYKCADAVNWWYASNSECHKFQLKAIFSGRIEGQDAGSSPDRKYTTRSTQP